MDAQVKKYNFEVLYQLIRNYYLLALPEQRKFYPQTIVYSYLKIHGSQMELPVDGKPVKLPEAGRASDNIGMLLEELVALPETRREIYSDLNKMCDWMVQCGYLFATPDPVFIGRRINFSKHLRLLLPDPNCLLLPDPNCLLV